MTEDYFYETFTPDGEPGYVATHSGLEESVRRIRLNKALRDEVVNVVRRAGTWNEFECVARDVTRARAYRAAE